MSGATRGGPPGRLPVTVLAGFLGSGKTTLLRRLLARPDLGPVAVVINELGEVPIDGRLVVAAEEDLALLANGCACCTVRGDLVHALGRLLAARERRFAPRPFRRVVIEASGVASPGPIAATLAAEPSLAERLVLDGIVALAHTRDLPAQLARFPEAAVQLASSDLVVLNHRDRATEAEADRARAAVRERNPYAPLLESTFADVPLERVLALHGGTPQAARALAAARGAPAEHGGATAVRLSSEAPLDLDALKLFLRFLAERRGAELCRIKGVVRCRGHSRALAVQAVQDWLEIAPLEEAPPATSELVVLALDLDRGELERGFRAVQRPDPPAAERAPRRSS